jgi:hypothetical protein
MHPAALPKTYLFLYWADLNQKFAPQWRQYNIERVEAVKEKYTNTVVESF